MTADRREASFGIFGGDSEEHLQESFSDMARDLAKYLVRLRDQRPTPATAAVAPGGPTGAPAGAQALAGTWRGTLQTGRRNVSGPISFTVTLRAVEDGNEFRWSLLSAAGSEIGRGAVEATADGVRLTGSFDQDTAAGPPRVKATYAGSVGGDTFDATGVTSDQRVQTLSLRRVGP